MKTLSKNLALIAVLAGIATSCHVGPSGPDPGQELRINYTEGALNIPQTYEKSADLIISGDSVKLTSAVFLHDTIRNSDLYFSSTPISAFSQPDIDIRFLGSLPTGPATFEWEPTKFNKNTPPSNGDITTGVVVRYRGIEYYPVEGTTVITHVRKQDNGNIAGISGYFNGKLRAIWPAWFRSTVGAPVPPGYDPANPSLVGENLTVHSCVFSNLSTSNIPVK
ncbi:MAG: hypothetical protein J5I53_08845 [Bradyrhizobiaceae bacterium]|nr:hypothetical protein [Bradyrhizobiaceae bacterium]